MGGTFAAKGIQAALVLAHAAKRYAFSAEHRQTWAGAFLVLGFVALGAALPHCL